MKHFIFGLITGSVITTAFEWIVLHTPYLKNNYWDNPRLFLGYHFHHSLLGLILIISGIALLNRKRNIALFAVGVGISLIVVHTISDGRLIFIE